MASNFMIEDGGALLRKLYPVRGLIHVGDAGKQTLSEYAEWTPANAIFVISEDENHQSLSPLIESHPGWSSVRAVLADSETERDYFKASNPRESGLLAPESLAGIWRNIKTLSRHRVVTKTMDVLLEGFSADVPKFNWIVVNCLPALSVIQGAVSCLKACDVIVTRAVLDQSVETDPSSTLSALDDYLTDRGFRRVSVQEERHPALGSAIFVRDWRWFVLERQKVLDAARMSTAGQLEDAEKSIASLRDEQIRIVTQRSSELEQSIRDCGEKGHLAEENQRQLDQMTVEHRRIAQELASELQLKADLESSVARMTADRDEQTRLGGQRLSVLEDRQRQLDQMTVEHKRIAQELASALQLKADRESSVAQITADRDEKTRLANQRSGELEQAARHAAEKARLAEDLQRQVEQLGLEHTRTVEALAAEIQLKAERDATNVQLTADRDEQIRLANQRRTEQEQAILERDAQVRVARELEMQIEQSSRAGDQYAQKLAEATEKTMAQGVELDKRGEKISELQSALEKLRNSRDKEFAELLEVRVQLERLNTTAEERGARITELEGGRVDLQARQLRLDREILKAEAQIDLIKDVILRDKAF